MVLHLFHGPRIPRRHQCNTSWRHLRRCCCASSYCCSDSCTAVPWRQSRYKGWRSSIPPSLSRYFDLSGRIDSCDLHDLARAGSRITGTIYSTTVGHFSWVSSVLYCVCTPCHNGRIGSSWHLDHDLPVPCVQGYKILLYHPCSDIPVAVVVTDRPTDR